MAQQLQASGFNSLTVPLLHSHLQQMLRHDDSTQSLLEKPKLIFCFIIYYFFLAVKVLLLVWVEAECLCKTPTKVSMNSPPPAGWMAAVGNCSHFQAGILLPWQFQKKKNHKTSRSERLKSPRVLRALLSSASQPSRCAARAPSTSWCSQLHVKPSYFRKAFL